MCAPATTATDLDDAERWAAALEDAWRALAAHPDAIALALDPEVASFDPYAAFAGVDAPAQLAIVVRNPIERADVAYRVLVPEGWRGEPAAGTLRLRPLEAGRIPVTVTAPESAEPRRYVITVDVTIDGLRLGEGRGACLRRSTTAPIGVARVPGRDARPFSRVRARRPTRTFRFA